MRYAFVTELSRLAANDKNIILLTADLGFTVFENFKRTFPKQFFNVGVAESNMMGVAAGLAMEGKRVFAYSIATFAAYRPYEFIRNDIAGHNLGVTIVASGAGLSYGDAGFSHHSLEDLSIMSSLPNMTILCPADPIETTWATSAAYKKRSPVYLRLGRSGEPKVYSHKPKLTFGKVSKLRNGEQFTVFACGNIVNNTLEALKILESSNIFGSCYSVHTLKPIDTKTIKAVASKVKHIITVEEHREIGGLGSTVSQILTQMPSSRAQQLTIAVDGRIIRRLGDQEYLREQYGLSAKSIAVKIKTFIQK